jgi:hypothetical protein
VAAAAMRKECLTTSGGPRQGDAYTDCVTNHGLSRSVLTQLRIDGGWGAGSVFSRRGATDFFLIRVIWRLAGVLLSAAVLLVYLCFGFSTI